ncbi:MAG: hypothetical protein NUW01_02925 [Gemmatimonadaceae bacterium]|nr:hypothetical protein [Gemmatimonadaceae bacterium]
MTEWAEDTFTSRIDRMKAGASPHQREFRVEHPGRFCSGDLVRVGEERLVGTGKFYYGREYMVSLNEAVLVLDKTDQGVLIVRRGEGVNPAQRVRRGDKLSIIVTGMRPWREAR